MRVHPLEISCGNVYLWLQDHGIKYTQIGNADTTVPLHCLNTNLTFEEASYNWNKYLSLIYKLREHFHNILNENSANVVVTDVNM